MERQRFRRQSRRSAFVNPPKQMSRQSLSAPLGVCRLKLDVEPETDPPAQLAPVIEMFKTQMAPAEKANTDLKQRRAARQADLSASARRDSPARRCAAQRSKVVPESNRTPLLHWSGSRRSQRYGRTALLPNGGHEGRDRLHQFERINRLRKVQLIPGGENAQSILLAGKRGQRGRRDPADLLWRFVSAGRIRACHRC